MFEHLFFLICFIYCILVVESAERKLGGRKPSPAGPDPDLDATEPHTSGADDGEQGPVPRGAKTIHVNPKIHAKDLSPN